ncbi:MAG: hypothetical protein LBO64_03400 [Desulfovibrio sp.]|nr:hypothetical protein [Desulfovibrio sp.]
MAATGIVLQSDFTGGELAPALTARVDLSKYQQGCRVLENFFVQSHGGAVKRQGFVLLDALPDEARLVPFVFNQDQAYCLVFGDGWLRVAVKGGFVAGNDGNVYQIESPYTLEQAKTLSYTQSADVLFIACHGVPPQKLQRLGHNNWMFTPMNFGPPIAAPATVTATAAGANLNTPLKYIVTALDADGKESNGTSFATVTGPASNNWETGNSVTVSWSSVAGALEYRVYKTEYDGRPGFIATTAGTSYTDRNMSPSVSEGIPIYKDPFVLADYPGAVCIFEQRLVFASSPNRPQTIWMSKTGDFENFAEYRPVADDSSVELTIASGDVAPVEWMVALRSMILGTSGLEWEISGKGGEAFTAKTAKATPQSYWGSSLKQAIVVGNIILHVSSSGTAVRSLQYEFSSDSYGGSDLSILAAHLFEHHNITGWTFQKNPDSIVWAVRDDGVLLGLTFQAEHKIVAWHGHVTEGEFKAVCAVPNGYNHTLFACVKRDGVFYLERMADKFFRDDREHAVFLDCSLTYDGLPVETVSGLDHLNGRTVGVLADGAPQKNKVVVDGSITLDSQASVVVVGLPYTARLETMPVEQITQQGASVSLKKEISTVNVVLHETVGLEIGPSFDERKMQPVKFRASEPYGSPTDIYNGIKSVTMPTLADNVQTICLQSTTPTPATILAIISRIKVTP